MYFLYYRICNKLEYDTSKDAKTTKLGPNQLST